jgi:competence protein ComEC
MVPFTVSGLTSIINELLPEPHAGLLAGLLFGTKSTLPRDFYTALIASGTLHIVALSGENITIMESLIGMILLPLVGKRIASFLTIVMIMWFVWFVGPSSSIIRAAIMGSLSLIAVAVLGDIILDHYRWHHADHSWCLAY